MVKLSEIDIGTKDALIALLSAAAGYYLRKPIEEKRMEEKKRDAELFGRTAAQYLAGELKVFGPETYKAIDELTETLREVKEELKRYKAEK